MALVENALKAECVAIDTETNYWKQEHRDIRDGTGWACGVSIAYKDTTGITAFFLPFRYPSKNYDLTKFREPLQKILDNKPCIFHNAKFDLVSLTTLGLDTSRTRFYDTMLLAHLINENQPVTGKGLDSLAKYYLKSEGKHFTPQLKKWVNEFGWDTVPAGKLADYAATDAYLTLELFYYLQPLAKAENLKEMWKHKEQFTRLVMEMELRGIGIDTKLARQQEALGTLIMEDIQTELQGYNPASPKDLYQLICVQLGLPEIKHPKTGNRTFDKSAMEEYEAILEHVNNPTAQKILEYRGWQKTVSSNYRSYLELLSPDGRLRPSYKLHGTRTGRLSCEKPNLQQIPRESEKAWNGHLKRTFVPRPGFSLMEFDYSQLELRLGTAYAQEPHLMEVFDQGRDIFTEMANKLGQSRQDTKTMVYSIQYGAGVTRISNVFGISPAAARKRIENYYNSYPNFKKVAKQVEYVVARHKKAPLWSGRFRHFEYPEQQSYKAFNSVIQGGAADIVERVMLSVDKAKLPGTEILLTVHDSIVLEIDNEHKDEVVPEIKKIMEDVEGCTGQEFGVKFAVESKEWGK